MTEPEGTTYVVWVEVEAQYRPGAKGERYQLLDVPFGASATFDEHEQAQRLALFLHRCAEYRLDILTAIEAAAEEESKFLDSDSKRAVAAYRAVLEVLREEDA